ncbi:MAG: rod shape-determining protein MreC [Parachlamydiaceae bacterium]
MRFTRKNIFLLIVFVSFCFFLPGPFAHKLRTSTMAGLASVLNKALKVKNRLLFIENKDHFLNEEVERLKLENQLLQGEVVRLKDLLEQELALLSEGFNEAYFTEPEGLQQEYAKHQKRMLGLFQLQLSSLPCRVIFRSVNSWNQVFWVNVGEEDNRGLDKKIIVKNSPVVFGDAVVGLIDYVGKQQSRVRLITDPELTSSVRVKREGQLLAKGELSGQSLLLCRSRKPVLVGSGFNYDFPDDEGPARDLRTGEPVIGKGQSIPIVQVNDLLVTTGMDGVFPPGLKVATISYITPLKEGDYYYDLEAKPIISHFDELSLVFVLPPLTPHELKMFSG